jgi:hypothetical protein
MSKGGPGKRMFHAASTLLVREVLEDVLIGRMGRICASNLRAMRVVGSRHTEAIERFFW